MEACACPCDPCHAISKFALRNGMIKLRLLDSCYRWILSGHLCRWRMDPGSRNFIEGEAHAPIFLASLAGFRGLPAYRRRISVVASAAPAGHSAHMFPGRLPGADRRAANHGHAERLCAPDAEANRGLAHHRQE